ERSQYSPTSDGRWSASGPGDRARLGPASPHDPRGWRLVLPAVEWRDLVTLSPLEAGRASGKVTWTCPLVTLSPCHLVTLLPLGDHGRGFMTRPWLVGLGATLLAWPGAGWALPREARGQEAHPSAPDRGPAAHIRVPEGFLVEQVAAPPLV